MSPASAPRAPAFEWIGGALPLDFVNTVSWTDDGLAEERLERYEDLVGWAEAAGVVSARAGARLRRQARINSRAAGDALARAHRVRGVLHEAFTAAAAGRPVSGAALRELNTALATAATRLRLEPDGSAWTLAVGAAPAGLPGLLDRVVWEAARLLASDDRPRIKHCAADDCGWLFLDRSRNQARRWCDMKVCGNNAKARRFYRRHREGVEA